MALSSYNGWSGKCREKRSTQQYAAQSIGKLFTSATCELCAHTEGITYHSEEYGPTWEDFVANLHALCPYCHGIIHARFRMPYRFFRFRERLSRGAFDEIYKFKSLSSFFGTIRNLSDISRTTKMHLSGVGWLDDLLVSAYKGPPKIPMILVAGILSVDQALK